MKNLLCLALAALTLAGCATTTQYAKQVIDYGKQAGAWVGQKVESLYAGEGKPTAIEPQADGGKVVEYQHPQTAQPTPPAPATNAATQATTAETPAPATRIVPCTTRYRVDSTGTIRSWTIDGAGCRAVEVETPAQP